MKGDPISEQSCEIELECKEWWVREECTGLSAGGCAVSRVECVQLQRVWNGEWCTLAIGGVYCRESV